MIVLGIEGALGNFSSAVAIAGEIVASNALRGNVALESGLSLVAASLAAAGCSGEQIDRVAVGIGPGGFTGLRITVAYAKSLAQAWRVPLVPVSSFDVLEYGRDLDAVLTVVVGRPGIISARYRSTEGMRRASGPVRDVLASVLPGGVKTLTAINAPEDVLAACAEAGIIVETLVPAVSPPAAAVALAGAAAQAARSPHEVRADYGELPAAKVPAFKGPHGKR